MPLYYKRFFGYCYQNQGSLDEIMFFDISQGLLPRRFQTIDDDMIIIDEAEEVDEMYCIQEGFIGIGYQTMGGMKKNFSNNNQSYNIVKTQRGQ